MPILNYRPNSGFHLSFQLTADTCCQNTNTVRILNNLAGYSEGHKMKETFQQGNWTEDEK